MQKNSYVMPVTLSKAFCHPERSEGSKMLHFVQHDNNCHTEQSFCHTERIFCHTERSEVSKTKYHPNQNEGSKNVNY